ncbi:MAG: hypothetical protein IKD72_10200 [Clostridia bacterium]|nr:hypothetical protein [Clostridia bacterium]
MANLEDIKKVAADNGIELTEEFLDAIAGGRYSLEEWDKMTDEERQAAQLRSMMARMSNSPCELD